MSLPELISQAHAAGLRIHTDDGVKLTIRGPQAAGDLARALLDRKPEVLAELAKSPGAGHWLVASRALGRPVPVAAPYPHTCNAVVTGTTSGRPVRLDRRDCVACQADPAAPDDAPAPALGQAARLAPITQPAQPCAAGVTPCGVEPARLYPCGWRCDQHAPERAQPTPAAVTAVPPASVVPSATPDRPAPLPTPPVKLSAVLPADWTDLFALDAPRLDPPVCEKCGTPKVPDAEMAYFRLCPSCTSGSLRPANLVDHLTRLLPEQPTQQCPHCGNAKESVPPAGFWYACRACNPQTFHRD
ncbi:hypothetical protein ACGFH8_11815 [Micromonospora sp. NPDC049175]|uniref:hypothetical protein n=1 Tax=Micromonospora sp. NPDC049175 TaxID=3364266 RepID=UPI00371D0EF2